jgi:hypothetical protein
MKYLVRSRVGKFMLKDALPLDDLLRMTHEEFGKMLLPVEDVAHPLGCGAKDESYQNS